MRFCFSKIHADLVSKLAQCIQSVRTVNWIFCYFLLSTVGYAQPSPDILYGDLFRAVQLAPVFEDSKTFPDCLPKQAPETILTEYEARKDETDFDLEEFVLEYFALPPNPSSGFQTDTTNNIEEHIEELWPVLTRAPSAGGNSSLIGLPNPYVVPGGRFREIYYWDSYFTMLGLVIDKRVDLVEYMVKNFAHLVDTIGFIPNGNRTYYTSRSQPPFFSLMVRLLADQRGPEVLTEYLPQLEKEYAFWMDGADQLTETDSALRRVVRVGETVLNRYWDDRPVPRPEAYKEDIALVAEAEGRAEEEVYRNLRAACESGWDFSSRWFADGEQFSTIRTTELIPVDLNSLMYHLETTLADAYGQRGEGTQQARMAKRAQDRRRAIQRYCWSPDDRFYYDYDFVNKKTTGQRTLAAAYPLFFKIARQSEARAVARVLEDQFLGPGGLRTTLKNTGQQWDAPNGWAPLQWVAVHGLRQYGYDRLATEISQRWRANNERVYDNTGKLVEKYNVDNIELEAGGGEYPVQDGFGWTNGVYLKMAESVDRK